MSNTLPVPYKQLLYGLKRVDSLQVEVIDCTPKDSHARDDNGDSKGESHREPQTRSFFNRRNAKSKPVNPAAKSAEGTESNTTKIIGLVTYKSVVPQAYEPGDIYSLII